MTGSTDNTQKWFFFDATNFFDESGDGIVHLPDVASVIDGTSGFSL